MYIHLYKRYCMYELCMYVELRVLLSVKFNFFFRL